MYIRPYSYCQLSFGKDANNTYTGEMIFSITNEAGQLNRYMLKNESRSLSRMLKKYQLQMYQGPHIWGLIAKKVWNVL